MTETLREKLVNAGRMLVSEDQGDYAGMPTTPSSPRNRSRVYPRSALRARISAKADMRWGPIAPPAPASGSRPLEYGPRFRGHDTRGGTARANYFVDRSGHSLRA